MRDYLISSEEMVTTQLLTRGISDQKVLEVFRRVNREEFVPVLMKKTAWGDHPLPIGRGQTISQPYMVAAMTELLRLKGGEKVLEIGTGSGYQAAILAELAGEVYSVERHEELVQGAKAVLDRLGYKNIYLKTGDGTCGWEEKAPYQGIIVTAGTPEVPQPLVDQLDIGGRLVAPVGGRLTQLLTVVTRTESGIETQELFGCMFVPLVGKYGWRE